MPTSGLLLGQQIVIMTTCGATSKDIVGIIRNLIFSDAYLMSYNVHCILYIFQTIPHYLHPYTHLQETGRTEG